MPEGIKVPNMTSESELKCHSLIRTKMSGYWKFLIIFMLHLLDPELPEGQTPGCADRHHYILHLHRQR